MAGGDCADQPVAEPDPVADRDVHMLVQQPPGQALPAPLRALWWSMLAYLLGKLQAIPDGDGTLLDHSLILYGTNMGNSNQHMHYDVPHILVGGANGQLKGNRHLVYPKETPLNNLFLNMFDMAGVPHVDGFGDSTGRLTAL